MIQILNQTPQFTVVVKPYRVSSHSTPQDLGSNNLVDLLKEQLNISLAPVTRLDKGAFGLVLMSNDNDFINNALITKTYTALVFGDLQTNLEIDLSLTVKKYGKKKNQTAITKVTPIKSGKEFTLVNVKIDTGRHHQIRRHLSLKGFPIVGDFRHGFKEVNLALQTKVGTTLLMHLACTQMNVEYAGKSYEFEIDVPEEWLKVV